MLREYIKKPGTPFMTKRFDWKQLPQQPNFNGQT